MTLQQLLGYNPQMSVFWRKLGAGFILLWALMDLSLPGVCKEEGFGSALTDTQVVGLVESAKTPAAHAASSTPINTPSDMPGREDCFCCCSHVAPVQIFSLPKQALLEQYEDTSPILLQLEYTPFLYHPPRS